MSSPIHDQLLGEITTELDRVGAELKDGGHELMSFLRQHIHPPKPYASTGGAADAAETPTPKGPSAMSLATIAAAVKSDLAALQTNAESDAARIKTVVEQHFPEIERLGQLVDSDPLVQLALGELVPAPLRQLAADAVTTLVKAFSAAPAPAAETPAADDAPAQQPQNSGIAQ